MQPNLGKLDRIIRLVIGLTLVSLVFFGPQTPWGWFGLVFFASAMVRWDPLYHFLGVSTCIPIQYTWKH